jgi:WD40 repeat protein
VFATASRDKTVKIWKSSAELKKWNCITTIKVKEAATALSFSRMDGHTRQYLAVGLETGDILIYSNKRETPSHWTPCMTLDPKFRHVGHVHRLAWRPGDENGLQLASCSEDGTLRLFSIQETADIKEDRENQ